MRVAVFSTKPYDRKFLGAANAAGDHELVFLEPRLTAQTARLAEGSAAVCAFVNDDLGDEVLERLAEVGVRVVALRAAGFNNVDVAAARRLGLTVVRVPEYSPHAVAEHTVGLILALNRKIHRAYNRVREHNFALTGLLGFDLHGRTVGIVGTGRIGVCVAQIMTAFGCRVLASDPQRSDAAIAAGAEYVPLEHLLAESDIVTLHCPLTADTRHLIDADRVKLLREGMMLINTGRGSLVDTRAVIDGLKSGRIGYLGLDVYEEETDLFFEDLSDRVLGDDDFARLTTFPNVLVTGHQAFFTSDGLHSIAATTIANLTAVAHSGPDAVTGPARVC
ncbi:2-hydroxyacid dehydrogenase [Micromonospora endophytica]|uniref:Hydroxyacid dehydrogenase n=1 Tax=Micromonospora endophytica TaxID=515350 RepID=A0A2W2C1P7_9ACTN|nr:2-hydroxyacid dehydrogenase [Micromonospora endophytica]PZF93411.1 hydroxyacid dehydrogenase [Micromonospora endophytica]RIW50844.1 2-hydroxyacid dehydrogenase [Micromonospora endophytica]BCJ58379.1 lactate dehydrogenase [Micromonospora endophytica]